MLSIIICSISPERLQSVRKNIEETIGVEHEFIVIDNREKKWPIAKAYNYAARGAKCPYLFFVHEDVKFHSIGWGSFIESKLQEPDCGVIGFTGSKVMYRCYSGWGQSYKWVCSYLYQSTDGLTFFNVHNAYLEHEFEEVVALDGLGMFVRKEVWASYPFDEELLTGFHCYDVDFSLQIAASKRYKNYVSCSNKVLIEHFSLGNRNTAWYEDTIRLFKSKWSYILPLKVSGCVVTPKEEKKMEERFFNIFLRDMIKTGCPVKKKLMKEFLCYSFSWKHLLHCISMIYICLKVSLSSSKVI